MSKLKVIDLPRKYKYREGISKKEYKKYDKFNKVSYSQINSFLDDNYRGDYIGGYFLGEWKEGGVFAKYGSQVGQVVEDETIGELLSEEDVRIIKDNIPRPKTAKYETEIVIDLEPFGLKETCMQGYIDKEDEPEENKLIISDVKTGNFKKKPAFYSSLEYNQTTCYAYARDLEGYEILDSNVLLLGRKGNTTDRDAVSSAGNPLYLRLSGEYKEIPTPYSRERAEKFLKKVAKTCVDISDYYKLYKKLF